MEAQRTQQAAAGGRDGDGGRRRPHQPHRGSGKNRRRELAGLCLTCNRPGHHWQECRERCVHCVTYNHPGRACAGSINFYRRNGYSTGPRRATMPARSETARATPAPQAPPVPTAPPAPTAHVAYQAILAYQEARAYQEAQAYQAPPALQALPAPMVLQPHEGMRLYESLEGYVARVRYEAREQAYAEGFFVGYKRGGRDNCARLEADMATLGSQFTPTVKRFGYCLR